MPTLAAFLNVKISGDIAREIDGTSLIGKISVATPQVNFFQNKLDITWQTLDSAGTVKIWLSKTNDFKTGGKDQYLLLKEIPAAQSSAVIDISSYQSPFYKLVVEGQYNSVNKWVSKAN